MNFTVYRSSAGSGKTYTLVKEYLRLALGSDRPDYYRHILAITFTNKAAAEMKVRVIAKLEELANGELDTHLARDLVKALAIDPMELQERASKILTSILHHYTDFSISTIDKFVHQILRTFSYDLHIPMNFDVEMDASLLLSQAIDILVSEVGRNDDITKALIEFAEIKSDADKSWHIESDLGDLAKILVTEDGQLNMDKLRSIDLKQFFEIRRTIAKELKEHETYLKEVARKAQQLINESGVNENAFYQGSRGIARFYRNVVDGNLDKLGNKYAATSVLEDKWFAAKASASDKSSIENIKPQLVQAYNETQEWAEKLLPRYTLLELIHKNIYALSVLHEIEKVLEEIKKEGNLIHISDFNKLIAGVVMSEPAPFIYERMGYRYRNFLVDEFQDTSIMQWQNLLPLFDESLSNDQFTMVVGDAKQAIYRWRGGEVEQFSKLPNIHLSPSLKNRMETDPFFHQLMTEREDTLKRNYNPQRLGNNYRSKREVVEFNNQFFHFVAGHLDTEYQNIYENLEQGFLEDNTGGYVSIEFIPKATKEDFEDTTLDKILTNIKDLQSEGFRLQDIAILTRSNWQGSLTARFLLENGISVISSESLLLSSSEQVNLLISTFRYLSDETNIIAAAEITRWLCLHKFHEKDLHLELVQLSQSKKLNLLREYIAVSNSEISLGYLSRLPIYEIAEKLVQLYFGDQPNPYIQFFLDQVLNFSAKKGNNIFDFLEWWEQNKDKFSIIVPETHNAVRILTIHKSKGLEFPVVIYPFANEKADLRNKLLWVELEHDNVNGLPTAIVNSSAALENTTHSSEYISEKNKARMDVYNLLYVALTRPVNRLYVLTEQLDQKYNSPDSIASLFREFLKSTGQYEDSRDLYWFGEPRPFEVHQESASETMEIDTFQSHDWRERIAISRQSEQAWGLEQERQEKLDYGNLIHTALSRVKSSNELSNAIASMQEEGIINGDVPQELMEKLTSLLQQPDIAPLFAEGKKVRNEADILLKDGTWLRPDRVMINGSKIQLVEFKTGAELETHHEQIGKYESLLKEMGFTEVEKYLIYTTEERLVRV